MPPNQGVTTHEVIIQSFIAFIVLFIMARVMGKRQVAQLTFFDYIVGITIGNVAASWSLDDVSNLHAVVTLLIWTLLPVVLAFIQRKSYRIRMWMDGRETVFISHGKIMESNLRRDNMDVEELMLMLRQKGYFKVEDVEYAVFENNGQLSVLPKKDRAPVTPSDLKLQVVAEHAPRIVIIDGHVMRRALRLTGMTETWLLEQVQIQGAHSFKDVFLGQIDSNGQVYVDLYSDTLSIPPTSEKPMVAAKLKQIQADLESFALQTENQAAKTAYAQMAQTLKQVLNDVSPYLQDGPPGE